MCTGVELGLLLTAAGTGTSAANKLISAGRQDKATALGIQKQGDIQREANLKINEQIADIAQSTPEAERASALEGFINTLRSTAGTTGGAADPLALGGQRFAERVASGEKVTRKRGLETAGILSRIDAPLRQRTREQGRVGGTALALDELGQRSSAESFISQLHAASKRPNPIIEALAQAAKGAGSIVALKPPTKGEDLLKLFSGGGIVDAPVRAASPFAGVPV